MTSWPLVEFDACVDDVTGGNVKTLQSEYLDDGTYPIVDQGQKAVAGYTNDADRLVHSAGPLIAFGDHTRCFKFLDERFALGADGVKVLRPKVGFDAKFLFHFLSTRSLPAAGYSRHFKFLKQVSVPKPPIVEQSRIAEVLDRADALRTKRREALALLDDLTQSIFHDMFGDPDGNQLGHPLVALRDVLDEPLRNGISPATAGRCPGLALTLSAVTGNAFNAEAVKDALFDVDPPAIKRVSQRDLLICRGNGNPHLVGRAFFPTRDMAGTTFPDTMIAARVAASMVRPTFLEYVWRSRAVRTQIESMSRTTNGTFKINQGSLEKVRFPLPPTELQDSFSDRITALLVVRAEQQAQSAVFGDLFACLQQRAFSGQL